MLYITQRIFSSLPLLILQWIGAGIGLIIYIVSPRYRRRLTANLQNAGLISGFKVSPLSAAYQAGMIFADTIWIWRHPKSAISKTTVDDWKQFSDLASNGKGLIILASHMGGFEIIPRIFSQVMKTTVMYKPARKHWINQLMVKSRSYSGVEFVEANLSGVRKIKRALKNGEIIGILADQVPSVADGVWAKFFNQYAYTTSFPYKLTHLNDVATIFMSAERLSYGRGWHVKTKLMARESLKSPIAAATQMNHFFEQHIMQKPHQYMWSYNRYKTPLGASKAPLD
jgi:KDO2-lipid IV(A) lauroyltransferase